MKKIAIREYKTARYLDSEEMISEYLAACLEDPNPLIPNAETIAAIEEARAGNLPRCKTFEELMLHLNADD